MVPSVRAKEVTNMNDTPENGRSTLKAKVLSTLDRQGFYAPRAVAVEDLPNFVGVEAHEQGDVKEVTHEMARDEAEPVIYKVIDETVMLEQDSDQWAASRVRYHDADELEWPHKKALGMI